MLLYASYEFAPNAAVVLQMRGRCQQGVFVLSGNDGFENHAFGWGAVPGFIWLGSRELLLRDQWMC